MKTIIVWTHQAEVNGRVKACNRSYNYKLPEKEAVKKFLGENPGADRDGLVTVLSYGPRA